MHLRSAGNSLLLSPGADYDYKRDDEYTHSQFINGPAQTEPAVLLLLKFYRLLGILQMHC